MVSIGLISTKVKSQTNKNFLILNPILSYFVVYLFVFVFKERADNEKQYYNEITFRFHRIPIALLVEKGKRGKIAYLRASVSLFQIRKSYHFPTF